MAVTDLASFEQFCAIDMRVGTIVAVEDFPTARNPAYKLTIDFGEIGLRRSSAQIIQNYSVDQLIGRQVLAVVNFEPKRIAGFRSEVLVCGSNDAEGNVVLIQPERPVPNGQRLY